MVSEQENPLDRVKLLRVLIPINSYITLSGKTETAVMRKLPSLYQVSYLTRPVVCWVTLSTRRFTGISVMYVENYNTNNYFAYGNIAGKHTISTTVGLSFQSSQTKTNATEGRGFPSDAYRIIANAACKTDASSTQSDYGFTSYFSRLNYKFNDKFYLI
jgi:hypothetical protein